MCKMKEKQKRTIQCFNKTLSEMVFGFDIDNKPLNVNREGMLMVKRPVRKPRVIYN
jgi:hypothetical protein